MSVEKSSEGNIVSALALEMRRSITALAGPRGWSETRERWIERAARRAGITYRQAKSLFYGECPDPRASVVERVRDAAARLARKEAVDLASKFETIAMAINATDENFHRETVAALVDAARLLRGLDRAGNNGEG